MLPIWVVFVVQSNVRTQCDYCLEKLSLFHGDGDDVGGGWVELKVLQPTMRLTKTHRANFSANSTERRTSFASQ